MGRLENRTGNRRHWKVSVLGGMNGISVCSVRDWIVVFLFTDRQAKTDLCYTDVLLLNQWFAMPTISIFHNYSNICSKL